MDESVQLRFRQGFSSLVLQHQANLARFWHVPLACGLFFLVFFQPKILNSDIGRVRFLLIFCIVLFGKYARPYLPILTSLRFMRIVSLLAICAIYAHWIALVRHSSDDSFASFFTSPFLSSIPFAFLYAAYFSTFKRDSFRLLAMAMVAVTSLQSVAVLLDWFSPLARELILKVVQQSPVVVISGRAGGLSSATGDGLSYLLFLGSAFALYCAVADAKQHSKRLALWVGVLTLHLVAMLFVGRTGLFLTALFMGGYSLFDSRRLKIFIIFMLTLVSTGALSLLVVYEFPELVDAKTAHKIKWSLEMLLSFAKQGSFSTASTSVLMSNMLFLPRTSPHWFLAMGIM